jgi:uncharacterized repeat protein (TIGR01451 family)
MATVIARTVDWLSPLVDSSLTVDRLSVAAGQQVNYTLTVRNAGPAPLNNVVLSNPVPALTSYVAGSLVGPAQYDPVAAQFVWSGPLYVGETLGIRYRLEMDGSLSDGAAVHNVAHLSDETGLTLDLEAISRVRAPDLSGSVKVVSAQVARPVEVLTYTLILENAGLTPADARLVDPAPLHATYLADSARSSSGFVSGTAEALVWAGPVSAGKSVTITIAARISPAAAGSYVLNRAILDDGWGEARPLEAYAWVEAKVFLPVVLRRD